jgi:hypothetical protein
VDFDDGGILGPYRSQFTLVPVFVDREFHVTAFDTALARLRALRASGVAHPRTRPDRHNVITFWGMPGTGKTALSAELEARFRGGTYPAARTHRVACRLDFIQGSLLDLEAMTIHLRGAAGTDETLRWSAFDVAFASYWGRAHENRPFHQYIGEDAKLTGHLADARLPDRIDEELVRALGVADIAALEAAEDTVYELVCDRIAHHGLFREIEEYRELVDLPVEKALEALPNLLAWDLAQDPNAEDTDMVVFIDSFERVLDPPGGPPSELERALRRFVWLLPNALFVITTRPRLSWAALRPDVEFSGDDIWPDLAAEERTQLELEGLAAADAGDFLQERLLADDGQPAIPENIRQEIVEHSNGYPLYLELAAAHFRSQTARGKPPTVGAYGGSFAQVVRAVMEGLDDEERHLARAAAMLGKFNRDLVRAAYPDARDAHIDRLLGRAFVYEQAEPWFPYSIHNVVADSILEHDHLTDDAWSADEWRQAAELAFDALGELLAPDIPQPGSGDRSRLIDGFEIGIRLTQWVERVPNWLFEAAYALRILKLPDVLELRMFGAAEIGGAAQAMIAMCRGMGRRLREEFADSAGLQRRALASRHFTGPQIRFVQHRLGKALEAHGDFAGADRNLSDAYRRGTLLPETIVKDYVRLTLLRGDPEPAEAWALAHQNSDVPTERAQAWALLGRIQWFSGDFVAAKRLFDNIVQDPELTTAGLSQATGYRNVALAACWTSHEEGLRLGQEALRINADAEERIGQAQAHVAMAIANTGLAEPADVEQEIATATELLRAANDEPELYFALLAGLFLACVTGERTAAENAEAALLGHLDRYPIVPYLREAAGAWMQRFDPGRTVPTSDAKWPNRTQALVNWRGVLDRRAEES